ncbi:1844_t:CDS:2 [Entrophospora sp. SA101]|nr:7997_t:CDS:2 [Entrophospora sp. SA101]CAJ0884809.1 1844_t:CDS:2 [Entrophospora sp. SA101]
MAPKKLQNCVLVDHFAIVIQVLLGAISCSTLIYKRHREQPQRPLLIWFYDVSKQVLGAGIIHGLNILFSYIAGSHNTKDTIHVYDCTIGVFILFVILKIVHHLLAICGVEGINSGDYGQPPQYIFWVKQAVAFIFCLMLMKIVVVILFRLCPFLFDIAEWILGWTLYDVKLQLLKRKSKLMVVLALD